MLASPTNALALMAQLLQVHIVLQTVKSNVPRATMAFPWLVPIVWKINAIATTVMEQQESIALKMGLLNVLHAPAATTLMWACAAR